MEAVVEVAILLALALPFLRLVVTPAFLRRLGGAPEQTLLLIGALAAYLAGVVTVAALAPALLRYLAIPAVAVVVAVWWRSRPDFGTGRNLPRGSLRIAPVGPWTDPDYFAADAARYGTVFKTTTFLAPIVCVVGIPAARDLFREHDTALVPPRSRFGRFIPRGFIRSMSDEDHARYAPILRSAVSGAIVHEAEPEVRAIIRRELSRAAVAPPHELAPIGQLTRRIVFIVFNRLFFGLAPDSPESKRLLELYPILDPTRAWRFLPRTINSALDEAAALVGSTGGNAVGTANEHSGRSSFLAAAIAAHPDAAQDPTLIRNLIYATQTGGADVAGLTAWVVWMLTKHPDRLDDLNAAPDPHHAARRIVLETLRLEQSEFLMRHATNDIHWNGFVIPKGWRVRICVRESHRTMPDTDSPEVFDPDRWRDGIGRDRFSPFGAATSRSTCLGEGLTLIVVPAFIEEMARGFSWRVVRAGSPEYSGVHWRPSRNFRVSFAERR